ncbi:MAG: YbhB/YbcL family Raf kinase inhibitor-like protein [Streptosporangiaceae bacterium]
MRRGVGAAGRPGRRWLARAALVAALIPLASGCGVLGGLSEQGLQAPRVMTVTSPAFGPDVSLPRQYTCHGAGLSPPLQWSGAPAQEARSFAIVVDDSATPIEPYVYWIVFDISGSTIAIPQNGLPPGARQARNSKGRAGYDPPCPVGGPHRYRFTVYALNVARLAGPHGTLGPGASLTAAWQAIAPHVIAVGRLTASANP